MSKGNQGFSVWLAGVVLMSGMVVSTSGKALEFDLGGTTLKIENLATVGALVRMQDRDDSLVGKSSVAKENGLLLTDGDGAVVPGATGLCVVRDGDDGVNGPVDSNNSYQGDTCSGTRMRNGVNSNTVFLNQPGALTPNGDNGNLNFDKYDVAFATAKLTSDFSATIADFNLFARTVGYFDGIYSETDEFRPDTTFQDRRLPYANDVQNRSGMRFSALDYFVSRRFELGTRQFNIKVGNQVLNWGESSFLLANSLNAINPPNQALLRIPGFDVKELLQPVGMVLLEGDLFEGASFQTFYQYDYKSVIVDPVGSYFSVSDTLGEGGTYAMLSFAKAPDDPLGLYEPRRNPDDPAFVLNSRSSRTLQRDFDEERRRKPSNGGQYGASTKFFLENFNNGTEVSFYFANYHARIPSVSAFATNATCIPAGTNNLINPAQLVAFAASCQAGNPAALAALAGTPQAQLPLAGEALPLDSGRVFVEYPENIRMFGTSFNTTVGDFALSGEYVYRPNLPLQLHTTDVVFALLQPGFPDQDIAVVPGTTLPGRRTAVPDFISQYRNPGCSQLTGGANPCVTPGQYIRGYEKMQIGQAGLTLLKTIGGDNPLAATQITLLLEMGHTQVFNMPKLDQLQFNGAGTDTHISGGIDGTAGINPLDVRTNPSDPTTNGSVATLRQNPTSQAQVDVSGFGTAQSYGYRFVTLTRYDSALFGANVEFLNGFFHDVEGVGPGLGQNFVEGRKSILSGVRIDYLSRFIGELRYTWFTGGANRDQLRDRDNILLFAGYQF